MKAESSPISVAAGAPPAATRRLQRRALFAGASLALVILAAWLGYAVALRLGLQHLDDLARQRLEVEATRLDGQLARFEFLPSLLEASPGVFQLLENPDSEDLKHSVSAYLESINAVAGAANLYILGVSGVTLAAADYRQPGTPLGRNLSFRPYVADALATGRGRFFGVGITSGRPGYYQSYALASGGRTRGVAAVKVNLDSIERGWREGAGDVLLVDEHDVAILVSRDEWRYRPIKPVSSQALLEIGKAQPYGGAELRPLGWTESAEVGANAARLATGDGHAFTTSARKVNGGLWRLIILEDEAATRQKALLVAGLTGLSAAVLILALKIADQRRREVRQKLASRAALQAANDMLEIKVQERTAELRAAQGELIHAGKLATLGQMSAGIVHELNQPLAAIQTTADNVAVLMERGCFDDARDNVVRIGNLVRRMGRLTRQLRVFAYKSNEPLDDVSVGKVLQESLTLLRARIKEGAIEVRTPVDVGFTVVANEARLEEVFTNVLANAIDAVEAVDDKTIYVRAARQGERCEIVIGNNGPCIPAEILRRLFEPFVTSKPPGKGLGLGLMLCDHIVRSFGGRMSARNLSPTGVEFVMELHVRNASEGVG
jgi:two-component system, NtrC family, C4-dicarboxylate transport sensor histidine kinase DctB